MANKTRNVSARDLIAMHNDGIFNDKELNFADIGLLCYMLSKSNSKNFDFTPEKAAEERGLDITDVETSLYKLKTRGYYRRIKLVDENDVFVDWIYEVTDRRKPEWNVLEIVEKI